MTTTIPIQFSKVETRFDIHPTHTIRLPWYAYADGLNSPLFWPAVMLNLAAALSLLVSIIAS